MRRLSIVLLLPALAILAACTSSEEMALLHREITDVQRAVEGLQTEVIDKSDLRAMEQSMQDLTAKNLRSNADLAQKVGELQEQIEALYASLEVTTRKLQDISQELAAGRAPSTALTGLPPVTAAEPVAGGEDSGLAGPAALPGGGGGSTPDELYRSAYEDYMRGNYDLAADGFAEYLRRYPGTELTDNALYWIGECQDAGNQREAALATFTRVLDEYPSSDKAAAAQLKKGLIYLKMGDQGQGVVNLQYVVYEHPGTREAELAREQLKSLGLTIR
jgi:tol-pal system protein YbgF